MHPTTRLVVWFLVLLGSQCLTGVPLLLALLALPLFGTQALRRCASLVWRMRWLLIALLCILGWGGAGEPLWNGVPAPSREGVAAALTQIGHLLLVLMGVTVLRELLPLNDLMAGAHRLFEPLRRAGFDPDRGLVRLLLVLRHLETMPKRTDWQGLLNQPAAVTVEVFEMADRPLGLADYLTMVGALALLGVAVVFCFRLY